MVSHHQRNANKTNKVAQFNPDGARVGNAVRDPCVPILAGQSAKDWDFHVEAVVKKLVLAKPTLAF